MKKWIIVLLSIVWLNACTPGQGGSGADTDMSEYYNKTEVLSLLSDLSNALVSQLGSSVNINAPVGSILAWHKSMGGTPALPEGWVECNGQTISDAASTYNGASVPDLNGSGLFLRGASTSGTIQGDSTAMPANTWTASTGGLHDHYMAVPENGSVNLTAPAGNTKKYLASAFSTGSTDDTEYLLKRTADSSFLLPNYGNTSEAGSHTHSISGGDSETRPDNMSVVWIIKIK